MCGIRLRLPGHLAIGGCTPRMLGCSVSMVCSPFLGGYYGGLPPMWPWGLVTSRFKKELNVYVYIKWGVGTGWVKKLFATW